MPSTGTTASRRGWIASLRKRFARESHPRVRLVLLAIITNIAALLYGFDIGAVSWIIAAAEDYALTDAKYILLLADSSAAQGAVLAGAFVGAAVVCWWACWFGLAVGRKDELTLSAFFYLIGALLIAVSDRADWDTLSALILLLSGRVVYGVGLGLAVGSLTTYLGEISPRDAEIRGALLAGVEVVQVMGILLGSILGAALDNPVHAYFTAAACAFVQLLGLLLLPESPKYMLQHPDTYTRGEAMLSVRYLDEGASFADLEDLAAEASPATAAAARRHVQERETLVTASATPESSTETATTAAASAGTSAAGEADTFARPGLRLKSHSEYHITTESAEDAGASNRRESTGRARDDPDRSYGRPSQRRRANTHAAHHYGGLLAPVRLRILSMDALQQVANVMVGESLDVHTLNGNSSAAGLPKFSGRKGKIFSDDYRPHVLMALCLVACRQLCGFNVIIFYAESLWADVGAGGAYAGVFAAGAARVLGVLAAALYMERLPRKALVVFGTAAMGVAAVLLSVALPLRDHTVGTAAGTLGILAYNFAFEYTTGTVMWVVLGEIFTTVVRREGVSLAVAFNFSAAAAFVFLMPELKSAITMSGLFVMSAIFCFVCLLGASGLIVETLGRSQDEVQVALANSGKARGLKFAAPVAEGAAPPTSYGTRSGGGAGHGQTSAEGHASLSGFAGSARASAPAGAATLVGLSSEDSEPLAPGTSVEL